MHLTIISQISFEQVTGAKTTLSNQNSPEHHRGSACLTPTET